MRRACRPQATGPSSCKSLAMLQWGGSPALTQLSPRFGRGEWTFCAAPATAAAGSRQPAVEAPDSGSIVTETWSRASHIRIIRPAAAFGRHPIDVLIRVLDVAGFAVNAVLRIDHIFGTARLLHPLVNAGRAIARGRTGEAIMLGGFLQAHVLDLQLQRLILFVI